MSFVNFFKKSCIAILLVSSSGCALYAQEDNYYAQKSERCFEKSALFMILSAGLKALSIPFKNSLESSMHLYDMYNHKLHRLHQKIEASPATDYSKKLEAFYVLHNKASAAVVKNQRYGKAAIIASRISFGASAFLFAQGWRNHNKQYELNQRTP